jgi:hypothetical protein
MVAMPDHFHAAFARAASFERRLLLTPVFDERSFATGSPSKPLAGIDEPDDANGLTKLRPRSRTTNLTILTN